MTMVKLCGLMRPQDAAAANEAAPDLAGMILSPGFRRSVTKETAGKIRKTLNRDIALCGVFVDPSEDEIYAYLKEALIDIVQLHGREDNVFIDRLHSSYPSVRIIKSFVVRGPEDIKRAEVSHADIVLLDGGSGQGVPFDHRLLSEIRRDYILAGGLSPENVGYLVQTLHPWGVDTSSGIETEGQKDPEKMKRFVTIIRTEDCRK